MHSWRCEPEMMTTTTMTSPKGCDSKACADRPHEFMGIGRLKQKMDRKHVRVLGAYVVLAVCSCEDGN